MSHKRLEGSTRSGTPEHPNIEPGIQAQIADPLWLLTRQWQVGEFQGQDTGSPVEARIETSRIRITTYKPDRPGAKFRPLLEDVPLEGLIEQEPITTGPAAWRFSAEAGLNFLNLLGDDQALRNQVRKAYSLPHPAMVEPQEARLYRLFNKQSCDGKKLYMDAQRDELPKELKDHPVIKTALKTWIPYYVGRFLELEAVDSAWQTASQEYRFTLRAQLNKSQALDLTAAHTGEALDWYAFDIAYKMNAGTPKNSKAVATVIPTALGYAGMPASRLWEIEDGAIHLAGLSAGPTDLARLAVAEFALIYSDDWFLIPVDTEVGTLNQIGSLIVRNTFGDLTTIQPTAKQDGAGRNWRFFELSGDRSKGAPYLFIPDTVLAGQTGKPVEAVIFSRDEMANLAWGIEGLVEGSTGTRIDRRRQWFTSDDAKRLAQFRDKAGDHDPDDETWRYFLTTHVPPFWVPFIPQRTNGTPDMRLRRGRMEEWDALEEKERLAGPQGLIMDRSKPLTLNEETITRGGLRVTRAYQVARACDGRFHLWMGRRRGPASGNRSSGRQVDVLKR